MYHLRVFLFLCLLFIRKSVQSDIKGFDDTILFKIDWPGTLPDDLDIKKSEIVSLKSSQQENFQCVLPSVEEIEDDLDENYTGPTPLELISPLFTQATCSFRLESYWTYEVCHGRYIRQYHEDREGKKVKLQEYILGKWGENYMHNVLKDAKEHRFLSRDPIPTQKVDNINLPYFEVEMDNGTLCELNENKPRLTKLQYVCYIHGKHEIYQLKETSTCVYEIIILTPLLCSHPRFKPRETGEHVIQCVPGDESGHKMPYNLMKLNVESKKLRKSSDLDRIRVELIQMGNEESKKLNFENLLEKKSSNLVVDTSPVENFLAGKHCLNGGTDWWKFEFCYGKYVEQYHVNKDGSRISIKLGYFDRQKHIDWIADHQHKKPKPLAQRKQLSHFYSGGSVCDKTGKPRQTEVKLKCLENPSSPNAVSLYLLEPRYCEYILGVESPLICDILSRADENGLVDIDSTVERNTEDSEQDEGVTTIKIKL